MPPIFGRNTLTHILLFNNRFVVYRGLRVVILALTHLLTILNDPFFERLHDLIRRETRKVLPELQTLLTCNHKFSAKDFELNDEEKELKEAFSDTMEHVYVYHRSLEAIRLYLQCFPELALQQGVDLVRLIQHPLETADQDAQLEILQILRTSPTLKWSART